MIGITYATPDMIAHLTGCADIAKYKRNKNVNAGEKPHFEVFEAETLVEAVVAVDEDLADMFGEEAYSESSRRNGCWLLATSEIAPCLRSALKAANITFDPETSRPIVGAAPVQGPVVLDDRCHCGCGGSPKGKNSRFLPGHDAKAASAAKARQSLGLSRKMLGID